MDIPETKKYSYTNIADTPQHGEIIESTYVLSERGRKPIWKKMLEVGILLTIVVVFAYLMVFLFHNGNHRHSKDLPAHPAVPEGATSTFTSSSVLPDDASCQNHPACAVLHLADPCCPNANGDMLACCNS